MRLAAAAFFALIQTAHASGPVVVELFTSQSCSSCPPAEAYFRELAGRPDLVALEWHVDYWNRISVGDAGRWKDPFSSPAHTERQRTYNLALRGTPNVYTPQMVIAGKHETVGSSRRNVAALIEAAGRDPAPAAVVVRRDGAPSLEIVDAPPGASAVLVTFKKTAKTRVGGGENHQAELAEAHVVIAAKGLGAAKPGARFSPPDLEAGDGCAVLIEDQSGVALAGAYCP